MLHKNIFHLQRNFWRLPLPGTRALCLPFSWTIIIVETQCGIFFSVSLFFYTKRNICWIINNRVRVGRRLFILWTYQKIAWMITNDSLGPDRFSMRLWRVILNKIKTRTDIVLVFEWNDNFCYVIYCELPKPFLVNLYLQSDILLTLIRRYYSAFKVNIVSSMLYIRHQTEF